MPFVWTDEANEALENLKEQLISAPNLAFPDMKSEEPLIVTVDTTSTCSGNWPYTKAANVSTIVYAFPWMELKFTTSFILIVRSFTCRPNHDMGPIFYLRTDTRFKQVSNL